MSLPLTGKSLVIIGGTTGIGLSAAQACAGAGANVTVAGRRAENVTKALDALGDRGAGLSVDAREPSAAPQAIAAAVKRFGRCDALYHVAGGSGRGHGDGPVHDVSDEGIDFTLRLNLTSVIYSNRAAAQHFLASGSGGVVLNMSSVLGFSPAPGHFATHTYAAAKSAIIGFTRSLAACYARDNIRFNVIAPALVDTPMAKRAAGDPNVQKYIATKQPLDGGRIGRPADLDAAAVYLLSDQSKFVTGQVLAVDGGWSVSEGQTS